jgi:DnaJ-class molecular chaperone
MGRYACDECHGTGRVEYEEGYELGCPECKGAGEREGCDECCGSGYIADHGTGVGIDYLTCPVCHGTGAPEARGVQTGR